MSLVKIIEANIPHIESPLVLGCLASGNASSFRRVVEAIESGDLDAKAAVLISNKADSPALEFAQKHKIPSFHISKDTEGSAQARDEKILEEFTAAGVNLFILSGYLPLVSDILLSKLPGINIHPSLLPHYGGKNMHGMHVHKAVLAAGEKITGATVHKVDEQLDHGPIIAQQEVLVEPNDTDETLALRVQEIEPPLMVATLQAIERRTKSRSTS
jgi:phosphoribosylglycinamide formyltransferase-1